MAHGVRANGVGLCVRALSPLSGQLRRADDGCLKGRQGGSSTSIKGPSSARVLRWRNREGGNGGAYL